MRMEPKVLYKYLPYEHAYSLVNKGEMFLQNLAAFKQHECDARGDPLEGHHKSNPDNDVTITELDTGRKTTGDFSFIHSTNSDLIFVYCLSNTFSERLYRDFNCNACVIIENPQEFIRRVRVAVRKLASCHKYGLLNGLVSYYKENQPAEFIISDPKKLAFAKDIKFKSQDEYRLAFGTRKAFDLEKALIANKLYDFKKEAMNGVAKSKIIKVGRISDIATIRKE